LRAEGAFGFDTSAYYTKFDGFIFKQRTGETCDDTLASCTPGGAGTELDQILFQQRNAIFYDAEVAAQLDVGRLHRGVWGIDGQYDFVRAWFDDALDGNAPLIPPHRLGFGLYYRDANLFARTGTSSLRRVKAPCDRPAPRLAAFPRLSAPARTCARGLRNSPRHPRASIAQSSYLRFTILSAATSGTSWRRLFRGDFQNMVCLLRRLLQLEGGD
jgi:hypothetical protein